MLNVAMAGIFGFMMDLMKGPMTPEVQVPDVGMLVFAIIMEIAIAMIFLSRVLKYKANRPANIIACVITAAFVIAGGSADRVYVFYALVEIVCMVVIVWLAWRWPAPEA